MSNKWSAICIVFCMACVLQSCAYDQYEVKENGIPPDRILDQPHEPPLQKMEQVASEASQTAESDKEDIETGAKDSTATVKELMLLCEGTGPGELKGDAEKYQQCMSAIKVSLMMAPIISIIGARVSSELPEYLPVQTTLTSTEYEIHRQAFLKYAQAHPDATNDDLYMLLISAYQDQMNFLWRPFGIWQCETKAHTRCKWDPTSQEPVCKLIPLENDDVIRCREIDLRSSPTFKECTGELSVDYVYVGVGLYEWTFANKYRQLMSVNPVSGEFVRLGMDPKADFFQAVGKCTRTDVPLESGEYVD